MTNSLYILSIVLHVKIKRITVYFYNVFLIKNMVRPSLACIYWSLNNTRADTCHFLISKIHCLQFKKFRADVCLRFVKSKKILFFIYSSNKIFVSRQNLKSKY